MQADGVPRARRLEAAASRRTRRERATAEAIERPARARRQAGHGLRDRGRMMLGRRPAPGLLAARLLQRASDRAPLGPDVGEAELGRARPRDDHEIDRRRAAGPASARKHSRQSRLTRLRCTAPPMLRATTSPAGRARASAGRLGGHEQSEMGRAHASPRALRAHELARASAASGLRRTRGPTPTANAPTAPATGTATSCRWSERGACGPCGGGSAAPSARRAWPCGRGSRGCGRGERCGAGRCASRGA